MHTSRASLDMNQHLAQRDRQVPMPPALNLNPVVISHHSHTLPNSARSHASSVSYPDSSGDLLYDSPRIYTSGERTVLNAANATPSRVDLVRRQYYDQLRRDEVRHRQHRSVGPILNNAKSLPNIAEHPEAEAQANRGRTPQMSPGFPLQRATRAPSFDPVLQGAPQVVYENNPRQSGAISEHTRVYHAQDRVVFESQPKPHHAIGHFSKSRADHPDQTIFENQAPQMRPIDLYEPRNQGLTSPSRQQQSSSAALIYRSEPPAHLNGDDQRSNAGSQYGSLPQVHQTTTDRTGGIMQQRNTDYQSHQQYHHEQQKVYHQQQPSYSTK